MSVPLYEDPHFTFRFADDRLIPRFHLPGVEPGRGVGVFRIDPVSGERLEPLATATTGDDGWVALAEPLAVRAGGAFVAVPDAIAYRLETDLSAAEFIDVLTRSTLAERRPVDDMSRIEMMLRNADLIVTARHGPALVGVSRAVTDFAFCTYLSDLAVDEAYQRRGIGRELIRRTHAAAGERTLLLLLAAPKAEGYYPHVGMVKHESCWIVPRSE